MFSNIFFAVLKNKFKWIIALSLLSALGVYSCEKHRKQAIQLKEEIKVKDAEIKKNVEKAVEKAEITSRKLKQGKLDERQDLIDEMKKNYD